MTLKNAINYQEIFSDILAELRGLEDVGDVATYIAELGNVNPNKLGVHLTTVDMKHYFYGDSNDKFSIQSITKVFALTLAFDLEGDNLWRRVGVEPSGTAFNSLVQLEYEKGIPRNPFINAGALVVCDVLISHLDNPKLELLGFIRKFSGSQYVSDNPKVAAAENTSGYRNYALINLMKDFDNINNEIHEVLGLYFYLCSIEMSCKELARAFLFLASNGIDPFTKEVVISARKTKRMNAIMQLCGLYDEAGEFAFKVGLPGKSGVGGGIIAIHPGKYCVTVWSPKLNEKGNSYKGMKVLESMTTKTQSSIF